MRAAGRFGPGVDVVGPGLLADLDWRRLPPRSFVDAVDCIYPMAVPDFDIRPNLDLLLLDLPSRNLSLPPNGLGYVNKCLSGLAVNVQVVDADIIFYHRFHSFRLLDCGGRLPDEMAAGLPDDPWINEHMGIWDDPQTLEYFREDIDQLVAAIIAARPAILGLSVQQCNLSAGREVARRVKAALPETLALIGGYHCRYPDVGRRVFPECDYMAIGEVETTLPPLVARLVAGERPGDVTGFLSAFDTPGAVFVPGADPHDLDAVGAPLYDWCDMAVYRNYNHYQLTPVIASRGCRWGRCNFCGEVLPWRKRSPENFVDEVAALVDRGRYQFVFSESDMNGDPEHLTAICDELIRREVPAFFGGQLRIHKKNTPTFFAKLRQAGFVSMRFGVDGWSDRILKLQRKGSDMKLVRRNLEACREAGMNVEVNVVVGCPGETDDDVADAIDALTDMRRYIDVMSNVNRLQLMRDSVYWREPESFGVRFRAERKEIDATHVSCVPETLWYSEGPYIDHEVRIRRVERIMAAMKEAGYAFGAGARPGEMREAVVGVYEGIAPELATLIRQGYRKYNLIRARSSYYAVRRGFSFDYARAQRGEYPPGCFLEAPTLSRLKAAVDRLSDGS